MKRYSSCGKPRLDPRSGESLFARAQVLAPWPRHGIVYGKSDAKAEYPLEGAVSPEDLAKTIYWALGVDPEMFLTDRRGRPVPLVESGKPLVSLFG